MIRKVAIIGIGRLGSSLSRLFKESGAEVAWWDNDTRKLPGRRPLSEVVSGADMVYLCIPSFALAESMTTLKPLLSKKCVVVSPIKGLDRDTGYTTAETISKYMPGQPFAILGGPMLSEELDKGLGGVAVIASRDLKTASLPGELFLRSGVNVFYSTDVQGVALVGVLKNVYTLSMGISEGLGWGMNLRGALASLAISEMQEILVLLGGQPQTVIGAAGLGDFIATGFSHHSRNHQVGIGLAKGKNPRHKGEGAISLPVLVSLVSRKKKSPTSFPLLRAIARTVSGKASAEKSFQIFRTHAKP